MTDAMMIIDINSNAILDGVDIKDAQRSVVCKALCLRQSQNGVCEIHGAKKYSSKQSKRNMQVVESCTKHNLHDHKNVLCELIYDLPVIIRC